MGNENDSSVNGQGSFVYLSCMIHLFEEWTGLENVEDYLNYVDYLLWVFTPLAVVFVLPLFIVLFLYLSILFLHVYKRKNELKEAYSNNLWDGARKTLATLWDGHATIWHGFKLLFEVFSVIHGPQEECVRALKNGHLLAISPGGVREALFSDESYSILWGSRKGFAQVAIDAKVPIIPMFTQNVREGFRSLGGLWWFRWLYEKFRLPIVPIYGGFPVKFRTYLGDPILYDPNVTAAELAEKAKLAVQSLIDRHQKVPGNILRALLERFYRGQKED
ncbi:transmembrane protein 68 isoform X2 [Latimeria chalumnae]|uniref:transmembrane protein 68 isoform X2 n=1 Tax=Latimeria chalumnae TaxID=7897 RepID=UPI0003C163F8|nr:PREDICTED: transmembrane protein 68 isoform X3 [Latimeria chalumnae]|eukprot:XP_005993496.1 PREDICTED: transmembrane protein 68 isoform X3 [Latimeria chalumnae]